MPEMMVNGYINNLMYQMLSNIQL